MGIRMLGIDHNLAPVDVRAVFAFTKKKRGCCHGASEKGGEGGGVRDSFHL